jgi:hypothetical protein
MKRMYLLLILLPVSSPGLIAQQEIPGKDSIPSALPLTINSDSTYYPPCILPLEPEANILVLTKNLASFVYDSGCHAKGAKKDLKNGKPLIWFPGGIVGCDFSSEADRKFQKKYRVRFVSPGCSRCGDEDPEAYNEVIFQHMDQTYGKGWRNELRMDAEGFKAPRTNEFAQKALLDFPSMQIGNPALSLGTEAATPQAEASVWWYILPTSGFALLLGLYLIKRKKD